MIHCQVIINSRVLICVASDSRKKTSSSVGMKNSVETSPLLKFRAEHCVPKRTREMIQAIQVWKKNKLIVSVLGILAFSLDMIPKSTGIV